jgi:hypothetical protein
MNTTQIREIQMFSQQLAEQQQADRIMAGRPVPDTLLHAVCARDRGPDGHGQPTQRPVSPEGILRGLQTTIELLKATERRLACLPALPGTQADLRDDIEGALYEIHQLATDCQHELHDIPGRAA